MSRVTIGKPLTLVIRWLCRSLVILVALKDTSNAAAQAAADKLAWLYRCRAGHAIDISMLEIRDVRILH